MNEQWVNAMMVVIKTVVFVYDFVTWPFYYYLQKPWLKKKAEKRLRCRPLTNNPAGPYRHVDGFSPLQKTISEDVNTLYDLFKRLTIQFDDKICLGTRESLAEEDEIQPNGRVFKKLILGNYQWDSYSKVLSKVKDFSRGLKSLIPPTNDKMNVVLFAETRAEWIIAALACMRYNIPVVTLYATLGEEAIVHGINETDATIVITSHELLPKFKTLLTKTPKVEHLVYMKGFGKQSLQDFPTSAKISTFESVEELGRSSSLKISNRPPASRETIAVIMYTSGSTGVPKGVVMSHGNILASIAGINAGSIAVTEPRDDDVYLAYLPLAHILELTVEFICLLNGVPIGYSSPLTISDKSSKIKKGTQGDATILQPTFMASVPLILDRIYKSVKEVVNASGSFNKQLFEFAYNYKLNAMRNGYSTPIVDFLVFRKIRMLMGGRLRLMVTGGAPLSPDTHDFIRVSLCCPLLQGYGLTETCACTTIMDADDTSTGRVGAPISCNDILFEDWEEGNYRTTDKPCPRGEILIGGENVTMGYYKLASKTNEDFFMKDERRWFRTGDIGEYHPDGTIKIIDRKKDLVKLQFGEYVSLGKVEAELKIVNLIENICVYGDSSKNFTVALITPNVKILEELGRKLGKGFKDFRELCNDCDVEKTVEKMLQDQGKKAGLANFEIPFRVKLIPETWLPDSGLVTAAYKLKRKNIQDHYQEEIDKMYATKNPGP